jgi:hypothetical protein
MYLPALQHIFGGQANEWLFHKCGFTVRLIRGLLLEAGLRVDGIQTAPYGIETTFETGETAAYEARQIYALATRRIEDGDTG